MRLIFISFLAVTLSAHDIITTKLTFTRDISRIFARRCVACHSGGNSIPFTTYEETRPWAVAIKEQVLSRQMPPWGAVKGFGHLSPDNGLTQEEIITIAAWVLGGAPKGNPVFLPAVEHKDQSMKPGAALSDAVVVTNKARIEAPVTVAGIRPITSDAVDSARIIVSFPDGHLEPLLWLFHYNPAGNDVFRFREPVMLPTGAIVEANTPLKFVLLKFRELPLKTQLY